MKMADPPSQKATAGQGAGDLTRAGFARREPGGDSPRQPLEQSHAHADFFRMSVSGIKEKAQNASDTCEFALCFMA